MTNIVFSSAVNRDDESIASSSRSEISELPQTAAQASSSVYTVIGKALRAFARPRLQLDGVDNDNSITSTSVVAEPLSTSVDPTPFDGKISQLKIVKRISYRELKTATSVFHDSNMLKSGIFGSVFKGWINEHTLTATKAGNGIPVAVKRLHQGIADDMTKTEWLEHVNYLGQFDHPNLVRTLGYCTEGKQRILVHEFMPRGSLEDHLFFGNSDSEPLSWSRRMKIALGAAKCLSFLHRHGARHGNIKPSNILVDLDYNSKLSHAVKEAHAYYIEGYYGFVKTNEIVVTIYTAPEYTDYPTAEGDAYSFGVVLLEILIGRKITWTELKRASVNKSEVQLISLLDRRFLANPYVMKMAEDTVSLVLLCLTLDPVVRETMDSVVKCLTSVIEQMTKNS